MRPRPTALSFLSVLLLAAAPATSLPAQAPAGPSAPRPAPRVSRGPLPDPTLFDGTGVASDEETEFGSLGDFEPLEEGNPEDGVAAVLEPVGQSQAPGQQSIPQGQQTGQQGTGPSPQSAGNGANSDGRIGPGGNSNTPNSNQSGSAQAGDSESKGGGQGSGQSTGGGATGAGIGGIQVGGGLSSTEGGTIAGSTTPGIRPAGIVIGDPNLRITPNTPTSTIEGAARAADADTQAVSGRANGRGGGGGSPGGGGSDIGRSMPAGL